MMTFITFWTQMNKVDPYFASWRPRSSLGIVWPQLWRSRKRGYVKIQNSWRYQRSEDAVFLSLSVAWLWSSSAPVDVGMLWVWSSAIFKLICITEDSAVEPCWNLARQRIVRLTGNGIVISIIVSLITMLTLSASNVTETLAWSMPMETDRSHSKSSNHSGPNSRNPTLLLSREKKSSYWGSGWITTNLSILTGTGCWA